MTLLLCAQAKEGTCEDYAQGGADSSISPYSSSAPAATPSPAARPGSPVTEGESSHTALYKGHFTMKLWTQCENTL